MVETRKTMNALELHGLEKHYPDFALGPIDLELPGGTVCGLIGENGAGLVDGVGDDLKNGVGAALHTVGAKNNGRALAHTVGTL